ncbi:gpW family head-tail joining protein, partial [Escherichia coli]
MVTVAELQALRQARLDLLTGKRVVSVQKDGFFRRQRRSNWSRKS